MNVKQLKEMLKDIPDNAEVYSGCYLDPMNATSDFIFVSVSNNLTEFEHTKNWHDMEHIQNKDMITGLLIR